MKLTRTLWDTRYTVAASVVFGLMMAPGITSMWGVGQEMYDEYRPVVTASAQVIEKENNHLTVHLTGVKHRNCAYLGLYAYGVDAAGGLHDIYREKIDSPEDRETRPKMPERQDFGKWRIWPVNWTAVVIYTRHECNDRIVVTKLAGIPLDK